MTEKQFWYGDTRLLRAKQKAYLRNVSYYTWVQGQQNAVAFGVVLGNAFAKKGAKPKEYPKWKDPIPKMERKRKVITKENLEQEFRKQQIEQNAWLFNR
jgi:hypothetical protein